MDLLQSQSATIARTRFGVGSKSQSRVVWRARFNSSSSIALQLAKTDDENSGDLSSMMNWITKPLFRTTAPLPLLAWHLGTPHKQQGWTDHSLANGGSKLCITCFSFLENDAICLTKRRLSGFRINAP
jgi:hypothetical protein